MQISLGLPEPNEFSSFPRLHKVQLGIQRSQETTQRTRLPITPHILGQLQEHWFQEINKNGDTLMLWAAATLCFFGFFRSGEITVPSKTAFQPAQHLAWGDVAIDSRSAPQLIKVHLKRSKCDQLGKGVDIYVGRTNCPLCPVSAVVAYMANRGGTAGPFLVRTDGTPLTKPEFVAAVRKALTAIGYVYKDYAGHSFRIGAATAAANAGLEDSTIQMLGR